MGEELVRVHCVRHTYPDQTTVSLCGLDFVVQRGQRVVVMGPNGSGKTTLLAHVLGLLRPHEGQVSVFGHDPVREWSQIRERIGVVLQHVDDQIIAPTVFDDICFSPRNYGRSEAEACALAEGIMVELGITSLRDRVPHYLSGGEKKKVALAGALVMKPELLILDEPFEGLDPSSKRELMGILDRLNRERQTTVILTTHDVNTVPLLADFIYILVQGGEIVGHGTPQEVFTRGGPLSAQLLQEAEAPVLVQLFRRLQEQNIPVNVPLTLEEAVKELRQLCQPETLEVI